ncbi:MAG: hypothetical protein JXA33_29660 [Anaerolineae bacterium]|nr:hypothetical protein [Anaerolineae bacterium]
MNPNDLLHDIHLLKDEIRIYEHKYNILSEYSTNPTSNTIPPFCAPPWSSFGAGAITPTRAAN